jgi:hypothetical protein
MASPKSGVILDVFRVPVSLRLKANVMRGWMSQNQSSQLFARAADRLKLRVAPLASPPCGLQSHFRSYCGARNPVVGWIFALAISVLWISSALADPITLRVIATVQGYNPDGRPSINVTVVDDGGRNLAQFTTAHVGEDIEVRSEGRLLMKARLSTALLGGNHCNHYWRRS